MPEITYRKVQGRVQAVNDQDSKDYFGVCIDDEWFNGEGSTDVQAGDTVKLAVKDSDEFIDIQALKTIRDEDRNSTQSEKLSSKSVGGAGSNPLTKNQQINLKVAHKSAVRQLDRRSAETDEDYEEMLTELTKIHLSSIESVEEWMTE